MTVLYGAPRRTNRRPREGGDVMNMVRDQAVMATDKAVFDNQTRPFRAPENRTSATCAAARLPGCAGGEKWQSVG